MVPAGKFWPVITVVEGVVVEGDHRGRQLGFPTANVAHASDGTLPEDGVYAGTALRPNGEVHLTAISIGTRETFYAGHGARLVEAYLLDFDGDLYGELLTVTVMDRIRSQRRFCDADELVAQIRADVAEVRTLLGAKELTRSAQ